MNDYSVCLGCNHEWHYHGIPGGESSREILTNEENFQCLANAGNYEGLCDCLYTMDIYE